MTRRPSLWAGSVVLVGVVALTGGHGSNDDRAMAASRACAPASVIIASPRKVSREVQVKALNDRGDVVGFADSSDPKANTTHAILWANGKAGGDFGVRPGYVASGGDGGVQRRVVLRVV